MTQLNIIYLYFTGFFGKSVHKPGTGFYDMDSSLDGIVSPQY